MTDTATRVTRPRRARAALEAEKARDAPRLGHRPGLDALRGVAVVSIVAYHADPNWFSLAPGSLDVFFVLSTFLVTTVLLDSLSRRGGPQGRRFFTRRARRLAAGLAAMVAVVLLLVGIGTYKSPETTRTAIGAVMLHANIAQFSGDYFTAFAQRNPLEHTWSLSVEEHFYIATFMAVLVLWIVTGRNLRRTRIALVALSGVVAVASVLMSRHLLHVGATPNRMYMGSDTRAVAAAMGVAVAAGLWGRWDLRARDGSDNGMVARLVSWSAWALFAGIVLAAVLRWYPTLEWFASGGWAISALAGALLVVASGRATTAGRVSGNAAFQWAGRRSYGIYLWHLPLLVLLAELGTWGIIAAFVGTFVVAELSHHLVERTFRADSPGGGALANRVFVPGVVVVSVALALVAFALPEPDRPEWAARTTTDGPPDEPPAPPPTTAPPEPLDVFVWGDVAASVVGSDLAQDDRFKVTVESHPECVEPASCHLVEPPAPLLGTDLVVIAITDIKAFDPPITNSLDVMGHIAETRATFDSWSSIMDGIPIALAMPPEARRGVDSALHFRQFVAENPRNLVLGADPQQWPDALYDEFGDTTQGGTQRILVVGDSVAFSLATEFRPERSVVWDRSRHGCDPSPGDRVAARTGRDRTPPVCDWRTDWAAAIEQWHPDVVVWHTGTWSTYDRIIDGVTYKVGTPQWHDMEANVHAEAMEILTSGGAELIVAVVAPAWETARGKPLETTPEESAWRMPALLEAVRDAATRVEGVTVLDTSEAICQPDCNRPELRTDGVHYSPEGAEVVAAWLEGHLPERTEETQDSDQQQGSG